MMVTGIFWVLMWRPGHITVVGQQGQHRRTGRLHRRAGGAAGRYADHLLAAAGSGGEGGGGDSLHDLDGTHGLILLVRPRLQLDHEAALVVVVVLFIVLTLLFGDVELGVVELLLVVAVLVDVVVVVLTPARLSPSEMDLADVLLNDVTVCRLHVARGPRALVNCPKDFSLGKKPNYFNVTF